MKKTDTDLKTNRNHLLQKITVRRRTIVKKPKSKSYFKLATTNKKSKIMEQLKLFNN